MNRLSDLVERDAALLAEIEAWDSGKPVGVVRQAYFQSYRLVNLPCERRSPILNTLSFVREMDLTDVVATFRYYAGVCFRSFDPSL